MDFSFIRSYFWWRLIGISLCSFMLPTYLIYFQKINYFKKTAITIFAITIILVHAFICYNFGFLPFAVGVIVWIIVAFLIYKLFVWVSKEDEY